MSNQTPNSHTPQNQTSSPTDGKTTFGIKPPIISPEIYERFEQVKAMIFSEEAIEVSNKALRKAELKKQQNEYIEINWICLETENLGRPQNPKIKISQQQASETIPQAWENNWLWYYNFPWAQQEAKFLWKTIPTREQWRRMCKQFWDDWAKLSKELNMPIAGFRDNSDGLPSYKGLSAYYWSSSLSTTNAYNLSFDTTAVYPEVYNSRAYGFSVRCIMKPEEKIEKRDRPPF